MSTAWSLLAAPRSQADLSGWQSTLRRWSRWGLMVGVFILAGCSTATRTPYTAAEKSTAVIPNMTGVRVSADAPVPLLLKSICPNFIATAVRTAAPTYLAVSGGGADGAYGAGVLSGWTASGTRPEFTIVSGASTGALIAPFAFLGSSYDDALRHAYTSGAAESLLSSPSLAPVPVGSGIFGNERLRQLVGQYVDRPLLARIAAEYDKGRCLVVVTTDLDAQRPVIWDMGRIASYGSQAALELFRDVLTASASVPVVFPPILIDADANGRRIQEMHVDGSVMAPVFTMPAAFLLGSARPERAIGLNIYILMNNAIDPDFRVVPLKNIDIAGQTVSTMIKNQTRAIIFRTFEFARQNGLGFNLTYLGQQDLSCGVDFDTVCMRRLYKFGYEKARSGRLWQTEPPAVTPG
jgi:patatin-like phospholipase